jgi:hypothetical protein
MNAAQAKTIGIADYLQKLGYSPAKIQGYNYWYCSPYREERTASFKVDMAKNTWHDFGTGDGGDIIDLAQKIWNCSVETALQKLSGTPTNLSFFQSKNILQDNPTTIITDIRSIAHPKLIEWVKERRIDLALANLYCREIHYQNQSGQFFSVGFRNDKGGYELNSPPSFKSCISPKEITTFQNEKDSCLVFEGFWDFLSYLAIQEIERTKHDVAVLNSTANTEKAMNFLKTHREISSVLHLDEKTPHIHATVVPIVTGERRKAKAEKDNDKKKYKKKPANSARLCADDVMARDKLKAYQDSYAEAMNKYGLQRGIEGSEARHVSTQQFYRDLHLQNETLKEDIEDLTEQKQEVYGKVRDMYDQKDEAQEKFLAMDKHIREKEKELAAIETKLQKARQDYEPYKAQDELNLIHELFPMVKENLRMVELCKKIGIGIEYIKMLFSGKTQSCSED